MGHPQSGLTGLQHRFDRLLLRPIDDVLDHRAGVEVSEVEHLLVAVGVGNLQESVVLTLGVHAFDGALDHRLNTGLAVAPEFGEIVSV